MPNPSTNSLAWVHLDPARALEHIGDAQTVRSMLPMLQELLVRDVPQIGRLLDDGDVRAANPLLHSLKGCMPIFCVPALCEELASVEHMSKAGGSGDVGMAFSKLRPKLDGLLQEVARYLELPR